MVMAPTTTVDGNEAAASIAHKLSEVIAIYPITPSSAMGESADQWSSEGKPNLWGTVPTVVEMQSEAGAAGAVHGALATGALATTFTSSQGLLLMIPNLYKIAGELTPAVFHVAARAVATHALSIFGDHQDVMAVRQTGFALLASSSVQEALDLAVVAHAATLEARVPFIHFFDGFRTSHEVAKIDAVDDATLRAMVRDDLVQAHRARALSPDHPVMRGTAQNPDVYFQSREAANPYYLACPGIVRAAMERFADLTGRRYELFEYHGDPEAERVVVAMGSATETLAEVVDRLNLCGEAVGLLKVRLFRPFATERLVAALPESTRAVAVLDRTKEPGSAGEPLYQDVVTALAESDRTMPRVVGGRYGLASKEFTPAMARAVFDELAKERPKNHFTVGIRDDVTLTSLEYDPTVTTEDPRTTRALFYGLGSDGTVGANKNTIKIIGEETDLHAQGYFVYDSKKSGSVTVSHLRFGPRPIRSAYLIERAGFVACHQFHLLERIDVLGAAEEGATFLLNSPYAPADVWSRLPARVRRQVVEKRLRFYVVDGHGVAAAAGLGSRVNTVLQTCFFALSGVLPRDEAVAAIKRAVEKSYRRRGEAVVQKNFAAVDAALASLREVAIPDPTLDVTESEPVPSWQLGEFERRVTLPLIAGQGDALPVSAVPIDGTYPVGTARWEKRNLATEIPVWDPDACIQCGKCALVCPHAAIREKVYDLVHLEHAPKTFKSAPARWKELAGDLYTLQVAPEDCTSCGLCVEACPVKSKLDPGVKAVKLAALAPLRDAERDNFAYFLRLPEVDRSKLNVATVKDSQLLQPLFEFSGACAGCGETPYLKLLSQLFGDRALIANATGCSSIYGGNLPTTPWCADRQGRGPAWANSLFEDNAEFGLGFRVSIDKQAEHARELLARLRGLVGDDLADALLAADQSTEAGILAQRGRVQALVERLRPCVDGPPEVRQLLSVADTLVRRSVWLVGGDGWAYDIGYGGLDHVLASGRNVNVLVLDTEVYSNTGGQMSKATPRGAVAKFAAGGKAAPKKDLGLLAMTYRDVYVARVALGANDQQTLKALLEAEAYDGPSLVIAYSACIAHGYDLRLGLDQQKKAVAAGYWPLYRFDPRRAARGESPLVLDSKAPSIPLRDYADGEGRFRQLGPSHPEGAARLLDQAQHDVFANWARHEALAAQPVAPSIPARTPPAAEGRLVESTA
jgi:pyruvate-ferredoxin/flavodoxin oxidoreductase